LASTLQHVSLILIVFGQLGFFFFGDLGLWEDWGVLECARGAAGLQITAERGIFKSCMASQILHGLANSAKEI
jgi:hypothetical protein